MQATSSLSSRIIPRVRVVLASRSPRRRELLAAAGIIADIDPVDVDEQRLAGESPAAYVERVARMKAEAGAARHPHAIVIGADTAVVLDEVVLGKPSDAADAERMLRLLADRDHAVLTGVAVARGGELRGFVERTVVTMRAMTDEEIEQYIATGEPFDKAGAYAIQGRAATFVRGLQGSYSNVVGLPMERLTQVIQVYPGERGVS
jgi:septum formation protein